MLVEDLMVLRMGSEEGGVNRAKATRSGESWCTTNDAVQKGRGAARFSEMGRAYRPAAPEGCGMRLGLESRF